MSHPAVESRDAELDAMAREFLASPYASDRFAGWPIDRRLHGYLRHRGLTDIADDGTICAELLYRVLDNIASALDDGTLRPRA